MNISNMWENCGDAMRRGWTPVIVPCASLKHLTYQTQALLHGWLYAEAHGTKAEVPFLLAPHDHGFFLTVPQAHHREGLPADLLAVCEAADEIAPPYGWIMLDVDGDELAGLPVYAS